MKPQIVKARKPGKFNKPWLVNINGYYIARFKSWEEAICFVIRDGLRMWQIYKSFQRALVPKEREYLPSPPITRFDDGTYIVHDMGQ